jgi:hypothetical protein
MDICGEPLEVLPFCGEAVVGSPHSHHSLVLPTLDWSLEM